jgi:LacI family transcriptional regulator
MKRPTQVDVARLAGVSRATVSYVMNDQGDSRVPISEETRQRVLNAIEELNYQVDARAQSLRSGDTKTIGVLLPIYENPFFWQMLRGISSEADVAGYSLLLAHSSLTPEQEVRSVKELAEQRVDGMVMLMGFKQLPESVMDQLRNSDCPTVEITGTDSEFDHVRQGYGDGTESLMSHLFELGHTRIGFVYGVTIAAQGFDRLDSYRRSIEEAGLPYDESLVYQCGESMEDGYQATIDLLEQPNRPTALLAINDLLAMAAVRAAVDLGLRVPDDVSIASFDDIPFTSFTVPRLTTVAGNPEQNGREAVQLLLKRLKEPDRPVEVIISRWELHIRESTGPAPV